MSHDTENAVDQLGEIVQKFWGYSTFRPLQREAMECVLAGQDSIVVLPTGGGKSLCFQAPALCMPGMAVVVSPLISLMKDQVDALRASGVQAACINHLMGHVEKQEVAKTIRHGQLQVLYLAPEKLMAERTVAFLRDEANVSLIAIDEAHCISEWGHDFRPEYRQLASLKTAFPHVAFHAYTATATEQVRRDISKLLELESPRILVGSFDRPNLLYRVARKSPGFAQIKEVIDRHPGDSGIIYCTKRADTEQISGELNRLGYRSLPYHAGMDGLQRQRNQEAFINETTDIIVATVAFGMGIDKSNVRYVIHMGMPKSLENYQQESGRSGRDQLEAECCLFYSGNDFHRWKRIIDEESGNIEASMHTLKAMMNYANSVVCRHSTLVEYFGEKYQSPGESNSCNACDVCLGNLEQVDEPLIVGQKILSSIVRQEQRFGGEYTAQVLKGSQDQRITQNGHDRLSTWGLLEDQTIRTIRDWIEQLVGQGYLQKEGDYNVLQVTESGWKLLRGEMTPRLLKPRRKTAKEKQAGRSKVELDSWDGVDRGLFERLRQLRRERAQLASVPAYIIFGDGALRDMARRRPTTLTAFATVRGVGHRKLEDYGEVFCTAISEYCLDHGLDVNVTLSQSTPSSTSSRASTESAAKASSRELFNASPSPEQSPAKDQQSHADRLFQEKASVADVARIVACPTYAAYAFLCNYLRTHNITDAAPWVAADVIQLVTETADQLGSTRLKSVHESLGDQADFWDIKVVLECLARTRKGK